MLYVLLAMVLFFAEWRLKRRVDRGDGSARPLFGGHLVIKRCHNRGFAGGILAKKPRLVQGVTLFTAILLTVVSIPLLLLRALHPFAKVGVSFLLAGAWNNVLDRLFHRQVTDYLLFPKAFIKRLRRFVFNLADMFLFFGAVAVFFGMLFGTRK